MRQAWLTFYLFLFFLQLITSNYHLYVPWSSTQLMRDRLKRQFIILFKSLLCGYFRFRFCSHLSKNKSFYWLHWLYNCRPASHYWPALSRWPDQEWMKGVFSCNVNLIVRNAFIGTPDNTYTQIISSWCYKVLQ